MVLEKTPKSILDSKELKPVNLKGNQPWILIGRTDAEVETPVLRSYDVNSWLIGKVPGCWERLRAEEEGFRGWDGWMASPTQWTWTWANSRRWWRTERSGLLQSMESQSKHVQLCDLYCLFVVQSPSRVWLFVTPWTAAHQASLSFTSSQSCPSSCPLHQWCHPAISSSDSLFSFCLQSFP